MAQTKDLYNVICFSNQQWDYPLWTNKKHVMSRLAAEGHNVIFVDPPVNMMRLFFRQLLAGKWSLERLFTGFYTASGLTVFSPLKIIPFFELIFFSKYFASKISDKAKSTFDPSRKTILWIYHVEIVGIENYLSKLKYDVLVYDCVDNYVAFPRYNTPEKKKWIVDQENILASKANVIFTTAPGIFERLKKHNKNVYFTPNAGDFEKFKNVKSFKDQIPDDLRYIRKPIVGFYGALDEYKFDSSLVRKLALDNPKMSFVLIGPFALQDREGSLEEIGLGGLSNVFHLGTKDFSILPKYMAGFDAFIIPYVLNDYTVGGCFPIKFHEALSAGLPTIVTDLPAYLPFEKVCYISKNYDDFSRNITKAFEEDSDIKIKERQDEARQHTWEGKVQTMLSHIKNFINNS